jgi:hypothetical protein
MPDQPNRNKKIFKENLYPSSGMQCEIVSRGISFSRYMSSGLFFE